MERWKVAEDCGHGYELRREGERVEGERGGRGGGRGEGGGEKGKGAMDGWGVVKPIRDQWLDEGSGWLLCEFFAHLREDARWGLVFS
jgi:hypothetical protein